MGRHDTLRYQAILLAALVAIVALATPSAASLNLNVMVDAQCTSDPTEPLGNHASAQASATASFHLSHADDLLAQVTAEASANVPHPGPDDDPHDADQVSWPGAGPDGQDSAADAYAYADSGATERDQVSASATANGDSLFLNPHPVSDSDSATCPGETDTTAVVECAAYETQDTVGQIQQGAVPATTPLLGCL